MGDPIGIAMRRSERLRRHHKKEVAEIRAPKLNADGFCDYCQKFLQKAAFSASSVLKASQQLRYSRLYAGPPKYRRSKTVSASAAGGRRFCSVVTSRTPLNGDQEAVTCYVYLHSTSNVFDVESPRSLHLSATYIVHPKHSRDKILKSIAFKAVNTGT